MNVVIRAADHISPQGTIVAGAESVAAKVLDALSSSDVVVDLHGVRGVPSTFFNIVLLAVTNHAGFEALETRVRFQFDSPAQESVYRSSLQAVRGAHA